MIKIGDIYQYHVLRGNEGWIYEIYYQPPREEILIRESEEWFDNKSTAGLAAIGHISLLENGEG